MASTWRSAKLLERYYTTLNTHSHFSILDGTMSVDELVADSTEELLSAFDKNVEQGRARVLAATDEEMQKNWAFKFGEHVAFNAPACMVRYRMKCSFFSCCMLQQSTRVRFMPECLGGEVVRVALSI